MSEEGFALNNIRRGSGTFQEQEEQSESVTTNKAELTSEDNGGIAEVTAQPWKRLVLGIVTSTVFFVSLSCTEPCLRLLGPSAEVPTLELLIVSYGIQAFLLFPIVVIQWRHCRAVKRHQMAWMLGAGVITSLSLVWSFQAAVTLRRAMVCVVGCLGCLLFTLVVTAILKTPISRVLVVTYAVAMASLILLAGCASLNSPGSEAPKRMQIFAYCSLVLSSLLMVISANIVYKQCRDMYLPSFLFWFALVGTVISLFEMMIFTTIWSPEVVSPDVFLPCFGFVLLFSASSISLHISLRLIPTKLIMILSPCGVLAHYLLQYTVTLMKETERHTCTSLSIVGCGILIPTVIFAVGWVTNKWEEPTHI